MYANHPTRWAEQNCSNICAVVFDESHCIITSNDYRAAMNSVSKLMQWKVPVIFLTATLPPRLLDCFCKAASLPATYKMIRAPTNRLEHIYFLKSLGSSEGNRTHAVAMLAGKLATTLTGFDRGLVFVRSMLDGRDLSDLLGIVPFISAEMKGEDERAGSLRSWKDGQTGGLLIGTSSLIQGVHYDHVRFVIFASPPWGLVDLVQGAGRAGRDGKAARVIVVTHTGDTSHLSGEEPDSQCQEALKEWLSCSGCLREIISSTMDGQRLACKDFDGAELCDRCRPGDEVVESACTFACKGGTAIPERNESLTPYSSQAGDSLVELLPTPPFKPQVPNPSVVQHAAQGSVNLDRLKDSTLAVFKDILRVGPTCSICWFLSFREGRPQKPDKRHEKVNDCAKHRSRSLQGFESFYDYSSPSKNQAKV
jgi:hypothetical protein